MKHWNGLARRSVEEAGRCSRDSVPLAGWAGWAGRGCQEAAATRASPRHQKMRRTRSRASNKTRALPLAPSQPRHGARCIARFWRQKPRISRGLACQGVDRCLTCAWIVHKGPVLGALGRSLRHHAISNFIGQGHRRGQENVSRSRCTSVLLR